MSKLSLIEQSKKAQTCSSSSSSSSLSTSTVASRIASSKSTSITTSSKRRSTTSRQQHQHHHQQHQQHQQQQQPQQQHHHHHQHHQPHQQQEQQQQQQPQLISRAASSSSVGADQSRCGIQQTEEEAAGRSMPVPESSQGQQFAPPPAGATNGLDEPAPIAKTTIRTARPVSALELRLKDQFRGELLEADKAEHESASRASRSSFQEEEEESRVRRRQESTCISSSRKRTSCLLGSQQTTAASTSTALRSEEAPLGAAATTTATSSRSSSSSSHLSRTTRSRDASVVASASSCSKSHHDIMARHYTNSTSFLLSDSQNHHSSSATSSRSLLANLDTDTGSSHSIFVASEKDFSSPDARSIFREVGSEFAMLENAMIDSASRLAAPLGSLRSFRSVKRHLSPLAGISGRRYLAISGPQSGSSSSSNNNNNNNDDTTRCSSNSSSSTTTLGHLNQPDEGSKFSNSLHELSARLNDNHEQHPHDSSSGSSKASSQRIRELLDRVQSNSSCLYAKKTTTDHGDLVEPSVLASSSEQSRSIQDESRKTFMSESIERIDQRMSDLCVKLQQSKDSKEAIDLLKIIIQMIEKAWSVPVCGDNLGFKLCKSLREAGGLDFVLGFIQDTVESLMRVDSLMFSPGPRLPSEPESIISEVEPEQANKDQAVAGAGSIASTGKGLKLDLAKVNSQQESVARQGATSQPVSAPIRDNDSDIITSDLGLDSTSVESLSYASPAARTSDDNKEVADQLKAAQVQLQAQEQLQEPEAEAEPEPEPEQDRRSDLSANEDEAEGKQRESVAERQENDTENDDLEESDRENAVAVLAEAEAEAAVDEIDEGESGSKKQPEIEEPAFLCARLLSQCLTSENRDYIVRNSLDSVIRLACSFSTIKSSRIHRLLSCESMQGSLSLPVQPAAEGQGKPKVSYLANSVARTEPQAAATKSEAASSKSARCEHSDVHAVIGTEILQHLFKHSEETCQRMISLGGLQAILYGCRSSNVEVLRHCASALANLALYGGPEGQQRMIEQKAHVWLFPLAFNEDDNVQYYACLAIVVLVANKEIEADVLKSSTLNLVEPFVLSHEPQGFAESTTAHIHGQSASWLRKLIPLLESKRQEARNLACFHFAMEAHIKREQGQTRLFHEIGAVEPLRKVGSSPQAIASRFACQALRLIGEQEPHKLSQQVPLWTSEDVVEWVSQIGFERFRPAFVESRVDGDLLLQLDEEMLKSDIGIDNGIIRRRFLRELTNLKRISDYSSIDKTGLCSMISANSGQEFIQYVYPLLQMGVTKDTIHLFDCEQLLRECRVVNMIHHIRLAQAIKDIQERQAIEAASQECNSQNGTDQKTLDVFVSYRRSTGSQLASLLKVHLQLRGFTVFIDVERLEAGKFDNNLLDSIKAAKNFIIVLSPSALDRCVDDHGCKDWVHKEIVAALASNCNIIPIIDNFHWPEPEQLPEDMRSIIYFNGVRWIHDYQDACIDKVERFIRGEINNPGQFTGSSQLGSSTAQSSLQRLSGAPTGNGSTYSISSPSVVATPSPAQFQFSRPPPFDGYHHPLSYISQQLQQHSQSSQVNVSTRRN